MRILGVSGSLREASTNTRLLAAATHLAPSEMELRVTSNVGRLPLFTPDAGTTDAPALNEWINEVRAADGIIISTPEYAGGYPGALKNAFDWLVSTDAFVNKPFMLLKASPRSVLAQDTFAKVLETMSGVHMESATAMIPLLGTKLIVRDILENETFAETIRTSLLKFASEVKRHGIGTAG